MHTGILLKDIPLEDMKVGMKFGESYRGDNISGLPIGEIVDRKDGNMFGLRWYHLGSTTIFQDDVRWWRHDKLDVAIWIDSTIMFRREQWFELIHKGVTKIRCTLNPNVTSTMEEIADAYMQSFRGEGRETPDDELVRLYKVLKLIQKELSAHTPMPLTKIMEEWDNPYLKSIRAVDSLASMATLSANHSKKLLGE